MLVKSIDVPDVDACAVPAIKGANVPVAATNVCVLVPATSGAAKVIAPDVSPSTDTGGVDMPVVAFSVIVILFTRKVY